MEGGHTTIMSFQNEFLYLSQVALQVLVTLRLVVFTLSVLCTLVISQTFFDSQSLH